MAWTDPERSAEASVNEESREAELQRSLRAEQLEQVYKQAGRNQIFSPIVATIMALGLVQSVDHALLAGWVALMIVASIGRQTLARRYLSSGPTRLGARIWERRFLVSTALVGSMWGIGGWLFMQSDDPSVGPYVYVFVIGMSGGTSAIYAAHGPTVLLAITGILLPPTVHMLLRGDVASVCIALGGILFVVATTSSIRMVKAALLRSIELAQELEHQARIDALSGLHNRRALMEAGSGMLAHAARMGRSCAALMVDVDHFKRINDTRGHAAGDAVIAAMGALLARTVRKGEQVGRIGGEEFVILLPDGNVEQARGLAARLLDIVRAERVEHQDGPISFTVSIGAAVTRGGAMEALLERADQALYRAKEAGRDRAEIVAEPEG